MHNLNNINLYNILHSSVEEITIDQPLRIKYFYSFIGNISKKKLLDVGCGQGYFLSQIKHSWNTGLDVIQHSPLIKTNNYICGDGRRLPLKNSSLDVVTCFDIIEHFNPTDLKKLLNEAKRVLKNNGRLYISTPNKYSIFRVIIDAIKDNQFIRQIIGRPLYNEKFIQHIKVYSFNELLNLFRSNGFEVSRHNKMSIGFSKLLIPFFYSGRFQMKFFYPLFIQIFYFDWKIGKRLQNFRNIHFDYIFELKIRSSQNV